jgi:hypothetical protein
VSDLRRPHVLFVDDDELANQQQLQAALAQYDVEVRLRAPEEVYQSDLRWAELVVVDYFLTDWPERDVESVARSPQDGLAAIGSMRSTLLPPLAERGPGSSPLQAVAFALWSANLSEASFNLPSEVLPHVFSRENNLEWAFRRDQMLMGPAGQQVALLAHAVRELPDRWPAEQTDAEEQLFSMLGLADDDATGQDFANFWRTDARKEALGCRPPLHELSARSHGLALVRWLLHRIFPYPCFLLDDLQLRARMRVDDLEGGEGELPLMEALSPYRYTGIMANFDGRRWWRAGIEDWLFTATDGQSGNPRAVAEAALRHGARTDRTWIRPVVVIGGDLARSEEFAEVEETVRVRPDDWPVFADTAYARRSEVAEDPDLRALVDPVDRAPVIDHDAVDTAG